MDGVKLREVVSYDIVWDRRIYRWDAMVGDEQRTYCLSDVQPDEVEQARQLAREVLKDATASLPWPSHMAALNMTCTYI